MNKRLFIKNIGFAALGGLPSLQYMEKLISNVEHISGKALAADEDFWEQIRGGYKLKPDYINLENGYYCFMPQATLEHFIQHVRAINYEGSYYMRTVQQANKRRVAARLSGIAGCSPENLVITRNTTESLDLIIAGQPWQPGDEAVMAEQDYGSMLSMFRQVGSRYGVVNKVVSIPNHPASDEALVALYARAITPKTKLLMVSHVVNITGQILPVQKICAMAHSKGVKVMVDGAHAFAHFQFSIPELGCDYYGASLHKWLSAPLGAGILYIKSEHINSIWPLLAPFEKRENDIYSLNHTGTLPVHTDLAIDNAIDYYEKLGPERKEERLRYLQRYWTSQVRHLSHIVLNTPADDARSCAIANVGIKGMKPKEMAELLMKQYKIFTVAIDSVGVHGCRITPNIYTTTRELDQFVMALKQMA